MPSPNTITAFNTFSPSSLIRSSQVNNNFSLMRGHLMPIDASVAAFADNTYDLGSSAAAWANAHVNNLKAASAVGVKQTTPTTTASPVAIRLFDEDNSNYIGLRAPTALASDYTLRLPDAAPASNGLVLSSDTDGRTYWTASSAAVPTITTGLLDTGAVTRPKLAAGAVAPVTMTGTSAAYTATTTEDYIIASGASHTITLYPVAGNTGRIITIRHNGTSLTQVYALDGNGTETIDGTTTISMYTNGEVFQLICNGSTGWNTINHYAQTGWSTPETNSITATTSAPTKPVAITDSLMWRRDGMFAYIRIDFSHAASGTAGSGDYIWNLPANINIDTSQQPVYGTTGAWADDSTNSIQTYYINGFGRIGRTGAATGWCIPYARSTTTVSFLLSAFFSTIDFMGSAYYSFSNVNQGLKAEFCVPVAGWRP